jgi:hypothetical protein
MDRAKLLPALALSPRRAGGLPRLLAGAVTLGLLVLTSAPAARADGPIDPDGKPDDTRAGAPEHYALWRDAQGWHLRVTTHGAEQHFRGQVIVAGGTFDSVSIENPQRFVEGPGKRGIRFDFATKDALDGLDFTVAGEKATLSFTLEIGEEDPRFEPERILIGKKGAHPEKSPFELAARDEGGGQGGGEGNDDPKLARERAQDAWDALVKHYAIAGKPGQFHEDLSETGAPARTGLLAPGLHAFVWSQAEVLHAAADLETVAPDEKTGKVLADTIEALAEYKLARNGTTAYAPTPRPGKDENRFWDDNGWVALALLQAAYVMKKDPGHAVGLAADLFPFLEKGQLKDGGEHWCEDDKQPHRGISATASDSEVALELELVTGGASERPAPAEPPYLAYARANVHFMTANLRTPEGYYWNSVYDDEKDNPTPPGKVYKLGPPDTKAGELRWAFGNQGLALGCDVLMYRVTRDKAFLDRASATAKATFEHFPMEHLWKQAPVFVEWFFRNLLALDHFAPDPRYRKALAAYLSRAFAEARDPATGLFEKGGIGRVGAGNHVFGIINQAAFVQMFALLAWPKDRMPDGLPPEGFKVQGHGGGGEGGLDRKTAIEHAEFAWAALEKNFAVPGRPGHYYDPISKTATAFVWSQTEIAHAALYLAPLARDKEKMEKEWEAAVETLAEYKVTMKGTIGYLPGPRAKGRWWDDNGVVALTLMQASYQSKTPKKYQDLTAEIFPFFEAGQEKPNGGEHELENDPKPKLASHATAAADQAMLLLHMATGDPKRASPYRAFAELNERFINDTMRVKEGPQAGLYYGAWWIKEEDNPTKNGHVQTWPFTMQESFQIGVNVLRFRITGDRAHLERASATAKAALEFWTPEKLWKSPPCWNMYFFRSLLVLDHYAPDPRYRKYFAAYLERVWNETRNPQTGLFTEGGVTLFPWGTPPTVLNQAGFVQMFALFAWPEERLPDAT